VLPFWVSIALLGLVQAALVALPRAREPFGWMPESPWWALVPAGSIAIVVGAIELEPGAADLLTWLALIMVPPLAALALADLLRGSRPWWALAAVPLFAVAWAGAPDALSTEAAATALTALACVALGWLLASVVPAHWLRLGIYAMAALDAALIAADFLQGPNSVLSAATPAELPRLQAVHFGSAAMGFGDLFVAALTGCLLAGERRRQLEAAALVAVLALSFDLLFFLVDSLPGTVPVAVALAIVQSRRRRSTQL
jgi:hypothetical protein